MPSNKPDFKSRVKNSFERGAPTYDRAAVLQNVIAGKLVELTMPHLSANPAILDAGCGTGFIGSHLNQPDLLLVQTDISPAMCKIAAAKNSQKYPATIVADMENLPFRTDAFDAVLSSMSIQWLASLDDFFADTSKLLKKHGLVAVTFPAPGTLKELRTAMEAVNGTTLNTLPTAEIAMSAAGYAGFQCIHNEVEVVVEQHLSLANLLQNIKETGANVKENVNSGTANSLKKVTDFYERNFASDGGVYCTWEIVYLILKL